LRQTSGMVANRLKLAGLHWPVPDFSTLCRRQKTLTVQIPFRRMDGPLNLLVDSLILPDLRGQIPEDEQIGTVTAPSRDIASRCPAGQWTAPTIHVAATPPSSRAAPLRSSRSERTGGRAKKTDRPHAPATTPCARRGTTEGHSGSAGRDTTPAAASRRNLSSFVRKRLPVSGCAA
jgi:hypothetical protein